MIEPLFNLNIISSFTLYIWYSEINFLSLSKGKSTKSASQELLLYIMLSNDRLIELTLSLSNILYVKWSISCFVNNCCSYSMGDSFISEFLG